MEIEDIDKLISSITFDLSMPESNIDLASVLEHFNECSKEPKRLENLVSKLQGDCKTAKEKLSQTDKHRVNLRKDLARLKEDDASIEKQLNKLKSEIRDADFKIKKTKAVSSISEKEKEIVNLKEDEMRQYKSLTGIRWNNNVPDDTIEGLITNSRTTFAKAIHLEKSMPKKKTQEILWGYIKEAGTGIWDKMESNKEN